MSETDEGRDQAVETAAASLRRQPPLWLALIIGVAALVLAALILVQIVPPLYALVFPLSTPLPDGAQEVEHGKPERGAEYRIYRIDMAGLDVAAFYEEQGSTCRYIGTAEDALDASGGVHTVAHCTGTKESGGQSVSWEVYIADGYREDQGPTRFRLYRYGLN
ncbi:hypothetical protein [Aggregatilinea lenta]|uniref:hypothetical protein n=1 Tax=Aggregatilinea lenta TaxID=913108 RepID=UPI000E5A7FA4|nr:hypothetical protein [Aggregatilinea lenta]